MINSVLKAIEIMDSFSAQEPRLSVTEISRRLGYPKSTVHNLLNTLASQGLIEKVDGDAYALGARIITMTQKVWINVELRDRAAPLLRSLADVGRESVYLTARSGDYVLYIYAVESSRRLLARTAVGDEVNMHCTGVGKALLAQLPDAEVEAILERVGLPRFTKHTITDAAALKRELAETRQRGYSIDRQEHEINGFCLGAPIFDGKGQTVGACSISGTDPEILGARCADLSHNLVQTAEEISRRMGYVPSRRAIAHAPYEIRT